MLHALHLHLHLDLHLHLHLHSRLYLHLHLHLHSHLYLHLHLHLRFIRIFVCIESVSCLRLPRFHSVKRKQQLLLLCPAATIVYSGGVPACAVV